MTDSAESKPRFFTLQGNVEELIKKLDKEDFQHWQPIYAKEARNQIERFISLVEGHVFQKHHDAFVQALHGIVASHVSLAVREIIEAKRFVTPINAHKAMKKKGDASRDLTRRIAATCRGPNGEALPPSQLVKHVQAERSRLEMKPLGKSRDGKETASDSALKAVGRHLKGYHY